MSEVVSLTVVYWARRNMMTAHLQIDTDKLADLCRQYHVRKVAVFGSALRDDFGPDSDVDLLVEFEQGQTPGWEIVDIQQEFSRLFGGRRVDIANPKYLNRHLKERILRSAAVQYEAHHAA